MAVYFTQNEQKKNEKNLFYMRFKRRKRVFSHMTGNKIKWLFMELILGSF